MLTEICSHTGGMCQSEHWWHNPPNSLNTQFKRPQILGVTISDSMAFFDAGAPHAPSDSHRNVEQTSPFCALCVAAFLKLHDSGVSNSEHRTSVGFSLWSNWNGGGGGGGQIEKLVHLILCPLNPVKAFAVAAFMLLDAFLRANIHGRSLPVGEKSPPCHKSFLAQIWVQHLCQKNGRLCCKRGRKVNLATSS